VCERGEMEIDREREGARSNNGRKGARENQERKRERESV